jgi:hypothetical protein
VLAVQRAGAETCVGSLAPGDGYTIIELRADDTGLLRVHLYQKDGSYRVAGLDRE